MLYDELKPGDAVRLSFGSRGSQPAIIAKRTPAGNLHAWKLRAGRRWTKAVRIYPCEVMERLKDESALRHAPPLPSEF